MGSASRMGSGLALWSRRGAQRRAQVARGAGRRAVRRATVQRMTRTTAALDEVGHGEHPGGSWQVVHGLDEGARRVLLWHRQHDDDPASVVEVALTADGARRLAEVLLEAADQSDAGLVLPPLDDA